MVKCLFIKVLMVQILLIAAIENDKIYHVPKIKVENGPWAGNGTIQTGKLLKLECTAPYSIYWDFIPSEMTSFQVNSSVASKENGEEFVFTEILEIRESESSFYDPDIYHGRSGNYTCKSSLNATLSSSLFVYSQDNRRIFSTPLFQFTFSKLVNGSEWAIPCPANLEASYLNVSLYFSPDHVPFSGNEILMFPTDANVRYDSRYGFLLNKTVYSSRPDGHYICRASTNSSGFWSPTEEVVFDIANFNVNPQSQFVTYTNKTEIVVTCEADDEVYINIENAFMLRLISSSQTLDSENFKWSVTNRFEEKADPLAVDNRVGEISCRIKSPDTVLHIWKHDVRKSCYNVSIELQKPTPTIMFQFRVQYFNHANTSMLVESSLCTTKWKCDLMTKYFDKLNENDLTTLVVPSIHVNQNRWIFGRHYSSTVFKCTVGNYSTMMEIRADINDIEGLSSNGTSSHVRLSLQKLKNYDVYIGDSISLVCEASTYFYRRGFQWKVVYKNGSEALVKHEYFFVESLDMPTFGEMYSFDVTDKNISEIICSANLWNTTVREITSFPMTDVKDFEIWDRKSPLKCNDGLDKPKIALTRWLRRSYLYSIDEYIDNNLASHIITGSDIYIRSGIEHFILTCTAAYPVKFFMDDQENNGFRSHPYWNEHELEGFRNVSSNGETLHHCFQEAYEHKSTSTGSATGGFRCQHFHDPNIYSTVYVYSDDKVGRSLIDAGQHQVISLSIEQLEVYIPCRVFNPNVTVSLYVHEDQGKYRLVKTTEYISYNPKKGFLMETSSLLQASVYICTSATNNSLRKSNSVYYTFSLLKNNTENVADKKADIFQQELKIPLFMQVAFFSMFALITVAVLLLLGLLKKQIAYQERIRALIGSNVRLESNSISNFNELHENHNMTTNGNARLVTR